MEISFSKKILGKKLVGKLQTTPRNICLTSKPNEHCMRESLAWGVYARETSRRYFFM